MSWYRQVKTLYTISFQMLTYICWVIMCSFLFGISLDYKMFIVGTFSAFFTQYLSSKNNKKLLVVIISLIVAIFPSYCFYEGKTFIFNMAYIAVTEFFIIKFEDDMVDYNSYKYRIKQSSALLIVLSLFCIFLERNVAENIFRFYILYLILCIMVLRESRRYYYNIKEENDNNKSGIKRILSRTGLTDILISLGVMLVSLDSVFELIKKFTLLILCGISFILDRIIFLIALIIGKPLEILILKLRLFFEQRVTNKNVNDFVQGFKTPKEKINKTQFKQVGNYEIPVVVHVVLKALVLFLVMLIIYKIIIHMISNSPKYADFVEEKERITKEKTNKKGGVLNKIKDTLFNNPKTINEQILNVYKKFEEVTHKAKIYKPYMTATQLKNVTKIQVDDVSKLDSMTDIYNETKFSNHKMQEKDLGIVKSGYENVKKQL